MPGKKSHDIGRGLLTFVSVSAATGLGIGVMVVLMRAGIEGKVDLPFLQRTMDFFVANWESILVPSLFGGMVIGGMSTVAVFMSPDDDSGSIVIDDKGEHELDDELGQDKALDEDKQLISGDKETIIKTPSGPLASGVQKADAAVTPSVSSVSEKGEGKEPTHSVQGMKQGGE